SATLGIIKGMVGPAILYLPHGFASAGYLVAVPVLLLSTVLFLSSSERRSSKPQRVMLSYPELAYRSFGSTGETIVKVGISMMQSGVCLTYLIFVPQNLHTSALLLLNWDISTNWCLAAMMAVQIPLSQIRDIRKLTVTNLLANMLILYGLITCLGFALNSMGSMVHRFESLPPFNSSGWFLFMGTSVLLFEGSITLLVPLQEAVQKPSDRRKFPSLYRKVILGIVTFYTFFGLTCWVAFGDNVRTVMTTSLPPGTMATTVQLAYSLAVVFTFPLQNFPSLEIICRTADKILTKNGSDWGETRNVISTLIVIVLSIIAVTTMNDLDKVVSLMGSVLGCPLAFCVPPLIHNRLGRNTLSKRRMIGNGVVSALGVVAMIISSITTIL
ncbi:amino acid/polyamine transporter, partial [Thalassiosira pseudonana CCMP1335]